jgi:hypothetical protein
VLTAFNKSTPANNASKVALTTSLSWASAGVVDHYYYCLAATPAATCDATNGTDLGTASTVTPGGLLYNTKYYWQVYAKNFNGGINANAGIWWSFTTVMPPVPAVPVLVYPVNTATIINYTPVLDWNDVTSPAPDHYDLEISTSSTFSSKTHYGPLTDSTFPVPAALDPGKTYYWRVHSVNYLDVPSNWATRSFKTGWLPPDIAEPADPLNPTDSNRPAFTWTKVDQATSYNLQVSKLTSFATTVLSVTVTGIKYTPTADLPANTTLYWRMRTAGTNGPSAWSGYQQFKTPNPPAIPTLSTPANAGLVATNMPTLDWSTVSLPDGTTFAQYELQVSKDSSFASTLTIAPITDQATSAFTFTTLTHLDDNATYFWRVMATNTLGQHSSWSSVWSFRTPMQPPVLNALEDGATALTVRPQFTWPAVATATGYTIQVSKYSGFASAVVNVTVSTTSYTPTSDLPRLSATVPLLYWRVKANGANPSTWSGTAQFTPATNPPAIPTLSLPTASAVLSVYRPPFTWGSASGANGGYQIQIATSNLFTAASLIPLHDGGATSTTTFTPDADLPDNATLYWRVRSLNTAGEYSWSPSRLLQTTMHTPANLVPAPGATNVSLTPTFTWDAVPNLTNYTIQVSTVSSFSSFLVNQTVTGAPTYTAITSLAHYKKFYWRVRANGTNPSPWAVSNFTTIH